MEVLTNVELPIELEIEEVAEEIKATLQSDQ